MNRFLYGLLITFFIFTVSSGQVSFSANAERTSIAAGEQAVVVATLTANKNLGAIAPPQVSSSDAFAVVSATRQGPSTFQSIEIVNGVTKQRNEVHYQFVYAITPKKSGGFIFPSLVVSIDGTEYKTNPIPFNATNEVIKNTDLKVRLTLSKHSLFVGEQASFSFSIAQRAQSSTDIRNGFTAALEQIDKSFGKAFSLSRLFTNQPTTSQERIDGENYNVYSLKFILYPLNEGTYNITAVPFAYHELKRSQRRRMDPFDDFFDSDFFGGGVQAIPKTAFSNQLSITVKAIPPAPAGYTGSVGRFTITSSVEPPTVGAGEGATVKITIKGNTRPTAVGDISFPKIDGCESFTPEKQTFTDTTASGFLTRRIYKYIIIPQEPGNITIPAVSFPYFDPESGSFKTASTEPLALSVTEGKDAAKKPTRYMSQEDIMQVGQDIRFIKTNVIIRNQSEAPYKNPVFFLILPLPFVMFLLALLYKYQASQKQKNSMHYTRQKALSSAHRQMSALKKQNDNLTQSVFLGKISQIIETYISNKFNFAATGRTLEELKDELLKLQIDENVVNDLAQFIQHLDSYRFGGLTFNESSRVSTLEKAAAFLESLEKGIRKEKQK